MLAAFMIVATFSVELQGLANDLLDGVLGGDGVRSFVEVLDELHVVGCPLTHGKADQVAKLVA